MTSKYISLHQTSDLFQSLVRRALKYPVGDPAFSGCHSKRSSTSDQLRRDSGKNTYNEIVLLWSLCVTGTHTSVGGGNSTELTLPTSGSSAYSCKSRLDRLPWNVPFPCLPTKPSAHLHFFISRNGLYLTFCGLHRNQKRNESKNLSQA